MLSTKKTKRVNNSRKHKRNTKKTKKNINTTLKKHKLKKTLIGGARPPDTPEIPETPHWEKYTYVYTIGTTDTKGSSEKQFNDPCGVAVISFRKDDSEDLNNRIYVADKDNHRVQIFNEDMTVDDEDYYMGNLYDELPNKNFKPTSVAAYTRMIDRTDSRHKNSVFVADTFINGIIEFVPFTHKVLNVYNDKSSNNTYTRFKNPKGIAVSKDGYHIYIADTGNHCVKMFDLFNNQLTYRRTFNSDKKSGKLLGEFNNPVAVALHPMKDRLYVVDRDNHRIQIFNTKTFDFIGLLGTTGSKGSSNTQFNEPCGIAVSSEDRIYVADKNNHRIQIFDDNTLQYITTLGTTGIKGSSNTQFNKPKGIAVSDKNYIYVVDTGNHRVQVYSKDLLEQYQSSNRTINRVPPGYLSPPVVHPYTRGERYTNTRLPPRYSEVNNNIHNNNNTYYATSYA
jgi:tripartite motif-containing protein 71